jgi:hypothetical protein
MCHQDNRLTRNFHLEYILGYSFCHIHPNTNRITNIKPNAQPFADTHTDLSTDTTSINNRNSDRDCHPKTQLSGKPRLNS